jgi:hypothetical protein
MHRAGHSPAAVAAACLVAATVATSCVRPPVVAPHAPVPHATSRSSPAALPYVAQFDSLWSRFDAVYPSFGYKQIDWHAQRARFRPRAERARSQDELVAVLLAMLAPLRDLHIWLVDPRGQVVPSYKPSRVVNFEARRWREAVRDAGYLERVPTVGDGTMGGYAYLHIGTWKAPVNEDLLESMLLRAREAPGVIIDVRTNAGGSDAVALAFAARFTRRPFAASYVRINTDPGVTGVEMPLARTIGPRGAWQYTRPVVVISGRGGFSATESFVAAMRTLPQVTVIGDTTGGASGNPATFPLGNGWQFTVPRWFEYGPDRQPIEWRGVAPHLAIAWHPSSYPRERDPLIDAAVGVLGERTGVFRITPAAELMAPRQQEGASERGQHPQQEQAQDRPQDPLQHRSEDIAMARPQALPPAFAGRDSVHAPR